MPKWRQAFCLGLITMIKHVHSATNCSQVFCLFLPSWQIMKQIQQLAAGVFLVGLLSLFTVAILAEEPHLYMYI